MMQRLWTALALGALLGTGAEARPVADQAPRRALSDYEDGYCDQTRYDEDPDCGGGVPASACARGAALAMARGYPGACMTDRGCMAIQPGQLDQECGAAASLYGQAPTCSPACLATLSAILPACRQELLGYEAQLNQGQAAFGLPTSWIWQPLFSACGIDGSATGAGMPGYEGGGGAPPVPAAGPDVTPPVGSDLPPPADDIPPAPPADDMPPLMEGGQGDRAFVPLVNITAACYDAAAAAQKEGYSGACSSDAGCRALTASAAAFEAACWEVFDVPPACPHGCRAAVSAVGAACSGELLVWQEALNLTVWSQMLEACDVPQPSG